MQVCSISPSVFDSDMSIGAPSTCAVGVVFLWNVMNTVWTQKSYSIFLQTYLHDSTDSMNSMPQGLAMNDEHVRAVTRATNRGHHYMPRSVPRCGVAGVLWVTGPLCACPPVMAIATFASELARALLLHANYGPLVVVPLGKSQCS